MRCECDILCRICKRKIDPTAKEWRISSSFFPALGFPRQSLHFLIRLTMPNKVVGDPVRAKTCHLHMGNSFAKKTRLVLASLALVPRFSPSLILMS
jgi:hypothetical protein